MNQEEYQLAGNYWLNIDAQAQAMPKEELYQALKAYILENDTCALATSLDNRPRITPIEYIYHEDKFYIFTEGGQKFFALATNPYVSIGIFDKFAGFNKLKGLQIQGEATITPLLSPEYKKIAQVKKLNLKALAKANHQLHLIQVTPLEANFLNSDFKKANYHLRQNYKW